MFIRLATDLVKYRHFGQILKDIGNYLDGLFRIWQSFKPTLAILCSWANFHFLNVQRWTNNLPIWSHCSRVWTNK